MCEIWGAYSCDGSFVLGLHCLLCYIISNVLEEQAALIFTGHLKMATILCSTKSLAPANRIMSYVARLQQLGSRQPGCHRIANRSQAGRCSVWHPAQAKYFYFLRDFRTGFVTYPGERESKAHLKAPSLETSEAILLCLVCSLMAQKGTTYFGGGGGWVACNFDITCYIRLHICAL
jgi:hypothetical protein